MRPSVSNEVHFPRTTNNSGVYVVISRLQAVHLVVDDINTKVKEIASSDYEPTLETFSSFIEKLLVNFSPEYDRYHLDEIVVAAVAPTVSFPPATLLQSLS